ncbi:MAG: aminotransferase class III-fold pyridoxal phosphate-dependent enzyme [Acidimicrobiia bacterium]|nr:aminotransferase class III-fold pyridoxal phosphate-dependent enzyme [Acidimicrobiia bacterium]
MTAADWVARDAAVVWHGFTQMSSYADNEPVIVERAEGHELIDVEGRRYLDAISSLWVTTLGHRVPELDESLADQASTGWPTRPCWATATASSSSSPRRSPPGSRRRRPHPVRLRRRRCRGTGAEDRLPVLVEPRHRGAHRLSRAGWLLPR